MLIYSAIVSLDGYISDEAGDFDWAVPDETVHSFLNDLERPATTYLYGRRMYEVMVAWETLDTSKEPRHIRDYAEIWRAADKIVYSKTLQTVESARTRIERDFDPEGVRQMKMRTGELGIGGAQIAAQAIKAGLVDEYRVFLAPVIVGGGTAFLPDRARVALELLDERRFPNGMAYLRYRAVVPRSESLTSDPAGAP